MMSYNNNINHKFSWRLNTRLRITIILLFVFLLLVLQIFNTSNSKYSDIIDKSKLWWDNVDEYKTIDSTDTKNTIDNVEDIIEDTTTDTIDKITDTTDTKNTNDIYKISNKPIPADSNLSDKLDYLKVIDSVSILSKIQFNFPFSIEDGKFVETPTEKKIREYRKESIKKGFLHAWKGYVKYAWGADELLPLSNKPKNNFNGWGATMVDALDTMWIMDLKEEFKNATEYIASINFAKSRTSISVFETVIRYLGGLLSAYELSGDEVLLKKAKELGDALIPAFNSPTGLPYNTWNITKGILEGYRPYASMGILSQVGTLQLEYMKLAQLTGNSSFFDKVQVVTDILDKAEKKIAGLYPLHISQSSGKFANDEVSFGGMGDSFYEYLIKQYIFVGGAVNQYKRMYEESIDSMHKYLIKEGQVKDHPNLLFLGSYSYGSFIPKMEHLACYVPGMLAIGSKVLNRSKDLEVAIKLGEACYWVYNSTSTGIGPEDFHFLEKNEVLGSDRHQDLSTQWNSNILPRGIYRMNGNYLLRPETIESLFILYRVTGDKSYQEKGWRIWQSIEKWCKTKTAYSGLTNVSGENIIQNDNMESFFLAETLKYLYLLFSTPDVISLDDYVFNTEAHPFLKMPLNI